MNDKIQFKNSETSGERVPEGSVLVKRLACILKTIYIILFLPAFLLPLAMLWVISSPFGGIVFFSACSVPLSLFIGFCLIQRKYSRKLYNEALFYCAMPIIVTFFALTVVFYVDSLRKF